MYGGTHSSGFPAIAGAYDTSFNNEDAFITKLNVAGTSLVYSTFLGGSDYDRGRAIALNSSGTVYIASFTYSNDFPISPGAFDTTCNG